ncbi:MAG: HIT family protein [Anaerolineales bacterium]|jgi:histidine triad (HIT) family protein
MHRDPNCVFCDIVHGDGDAHIIYRDELVTAFLDINPVNPGHTLVIPNAHSASIQEVPDGACGQLFVIGRDLDKAIRKTDLRCEAVNLYLADGRAAGQAVFHTHLHVIPRYRGDSSGLRLHADPPHTPSSDSLSEQARKVVAAFQNVHAN